MSETIELYQQIMRRHCLMADHVSRLADLHVEQGNDINAFSRLIEQQEPESSTIPTDVRSPEMAVHAPSTVPPSSEVRTVSAETLAAMDDSVHVPNDEHMAIVEAAIATDSPAIEQPDPASRRRSRTDYTAAEWAHSPHFLAYVTRNKPFSDWSAERQNAKRDEFTATYKDAPPQNRWGKTFAKFCAETAAT